MIPSSLYNTIVGCLPIVSVEAIIFCDNKLLYLKRNNSPAKGFWWFPGGRIKKGESLDHALSREIKEETGLELIKFRLLNVYSRTFDERHDITIAYYCECKPSKITLNNEHSEYKYFSKPPKNLHGYLVEVIDDLKKQKIMPNSSI